MSVLNFATRVFIRGLAGLVLFLVTTGMGLETARAAINHDGQFWLPMYNRFTMSDKVRGWFEVNPRFGNDASEIHQLLIRPALGYQIWPNLSIWQGYAWVTNYEPRFSDEHRIYQQLSYRKSFKNVTLSTRTRMEERFIRDARGVAIRARQFIRGTLPLDEEKTWSLVLYDEVFVALNTLGNGPRSGFDQNRLFVGINRKVSTHLSMDVGYQNQFIHTRGSRVADAMNHIFLVQWFIDWDE